MLAAKPRKRQKAQVGSPLPRLAPPVPARTGLDDFTTGATKLGIDLWPWQITAAKYLTALGIGASPLYREVAVIVARQNGKTELLLPLIIGRLLDGKRVMHTAQNRELPRLVHRRLSHVLQKHYPTMIDAIRRGAGQEEIWLTTGGHYRIVAPNDDGARGSTNDLVIIDELRQMENHDFIAAAKPTLAGDAQLVYLSNAGTSNSEVLNALKARAGSDPRLAYLEWSAPPDLSPDDMVGWLQANPAIGHKLGHLEGLKDDYRAHLLAGTMTVFETEQLCRWVVAMEQRLVSEEAWSAQDFLDEPGNPVRAAMGVSMDINGERASAVIAWVDRDEHLTLDVHDTQGSPIDVTVLGPDIAKLGVSNRVIDTAYDPYTDVDLARYLRKAKAINGRDYGNASEKFVRLVTERKLRIHDPKGVLTEDLRWTTRRATPNKSYMAIRANDEHSNTAVLAAIRAAWLATNPNLQAPLRMY